MRVRVHVEPEFPPNFFKCLVLSIVYANSNMVYSINEGLIQLIGIS